VLDVAEPLQTCVLERQTAQAAATVGASARIAARAARASLGVSHSGPGFDPSAERDAAAPRAVVVRVEESSVGVYRVRAEDVGGGLSSWAERI
jgi:hypothetical protein